jgi:hypothetical protein
MNKLRGGLIPISRAKCDPFSPVQIQSNHRSRTSDCYRIRTEWGRGPERRHVFRLERGGVAIQSEAESFRHKFCISLLRIRPLVPRIENRWLGLVVLVSPVVE